MTQGSAQLSKQLSHRFTKCIFTLGLLALAALPAGAQRSRGQERDSARRPDASVVPADARPPKGMCRIWIDGVPAAQQPAATDCATAVKNRPANGRVVFGDDFPDSAKAASPGALPRDAKGFTSVKPPPKLLRKRQPA